ncbi:MAG: L,D-transpeptidase family protein [Thermodesulfobacteriota bacterium]
MTRVAALLFFLALPTFAAAQAGGVPVFRQVAGEIRRVVAAPGDTLIGLGARHGVRWQTLAAQNGIADPNRLRVGQELKLDTRRIVPAAVADGLVVNVPEAMLYVFEGASLAARYPVGLGRPKWPTPVGSFTVLFRESDPTWHVPRSIQEEMAREGRVVVSKVPPGPDNPLGKYWIQLSLWGYGIHGTPFPSSIGQFLSHGCVRVGDPGIEELFRRVRRGSRAEFLYTPVKLAVLPNGEVWAEAHPDVYARGFPREEDVWHALQREGAADRVDREALDEILRVRDGLARQVGSAARDLRGLPEAAAGEGQTAARRALWRCLDCPPGPGRRITLQIEAREPLDLPNPFPIEIRDDAGRVVFRPQMVAQALVSLAPGDLRNFVWEVRDTEGQPLPPGSYSAVIRFFAEGEGGSPQAYSLSLPLWLGN